MAERAVTNGLLGRLTNVTGTSLEMTLSRSSTSKAADRASLGELRVGTSGWHYSDWWGPFYPKDLPKKNALTFYSSRFDATELNAPFYRAPTPAAVRNWADSTPSNFRFSWKASRFITHWRRLLVDDHSLRLLDDRLSLLGGKLGPVLFQLHPRMKPIGSAWPPSSRDFHAPAATASNSGTRAGTTRRSSICFGKTMPRSAYLIMHRPLRPER
jgi:hypothetical protein